MQIQNIIKIYGLLILLAFQLVSSAQISSEAAHFTDTTKYTNDTLGEHLIFVYTTTRGNYPPEPALTAEIPGYDSLTFRWIKFNDNVDFIDKLEQEDVLVDVSTFVTTEPGGYKVEVFNKDIDTTLYCWVNITAFEITGIEIYISTCDFMELRTRVNSGDDYIYFDLKDSTALFQEHNLIDSDINWTVEPEADSIILDKKLDPQFDAPVVNTRYTLTIVDNFGQKRTSYVDIEEEELDRDKKYLIATKADFEASRAYVPSDETVSTGQAPLDVQFENSSKNGVNYEWTFYDEKSLITDGADSVMATSNFEVPMDSIRYIRPGLPSSENIGQKGIYDVKLVSYGPVYEGVDGSDEQCKDTFLKKEYVVVDSVSIPVFSNVFTPPGEPNAVYHFENYFSGSFKGAKSVRSFSLKIYNRWGNKVYQYEGDINEWQGWDGTTIGNLVAKTGVYYYSAFIEGWDNKSHNKKGYIHLFRDDK